MHGTVRRDVGEEVGARIRAVRKRSGMGLRTLSCLSDVPEATIDRMATGRAEMRLGDLLRLALALGVSVTAFFEENPSDEKGADPRASVG